MLTLMMYKVNILGSLHYVLYKYLILAYFFVVTHGQPWWYIWHLVSVYHQRTSQSGLLGWFEMGHVTMSADWFPWDVSFANDRSCSLSGYQKATLIIINRLSRYIYLIGHKRNNFFTCTFLPVNKNEYVICKGKMGDR